MAPSASVISRSTLALLARDGEKPTSTFLKSGVPGIIVGVYVLTHVRIESMPLMLIKFPRVVFIALCICAFLLYRNRRRDAREAKAAQTWNED